MAPLRNGARNGVQNAPVSLKYPIPHAQFFWHNMLHIISVCCDHRVKYIFYLESICPIRTAENFEVVDWATGFANKHVCIVGLLKETGSVIVKIRT